LVDHATGRSKREFGSRRAIIGGEDARLRTAAKLIGGGPVIADKNTQYRQSTILGHPPVHPRRRAVIQV
jgi:hypothetical protein